MKRHKWGRTDLTYRQRCVDCGCIRSFIYGNRGGNRTVYREAGSEVRSSRAPVCVPDTPLMSAVRAYIKRELNP